MLHGTLWQLNTAIESHHSGKTSISTPVASLVAGMIDAFYGLIWAYSLPRLSLIGLPWVFFSFVSPLDTKEANGKQRKQRKTTESTQPQTKRKSYRKSKDTKGNTR